MAWGQVLKCTIAVDPEQFNHEMKNAGRVVQSPANTARLCNCAFQDLTP